MKARESAPKKLAGVITINEKEVAHHLEQVVRGTVEEALNALLDAKTDALCVETKSAQGPVPVADEISARARGEDRKGGGAWGQRDGFCATTIRPEPATRAGA